MSKPWPEPTNPHSRPRRWRETTDGLFREIEAGVWWQRDGIDLVDEAVVDAHCEKTGCGIAVMVEVEELLH